MHRRTLLRTVPASALAVAGAAALAGGLTGCSDDHTPGASGGGAGGPGAMRLVASDVGRETVDPAAIGTGVASVRGLGGAVYARLAAASAGGNLALSPYSLVVALAMAADGAAGATRDEMLTALRAPSASALDAGLNALTQQVTALAGPVPHERDAEIVLAAANQLVGQSGLGWRRPFLDALAASFGAGLREVDFVHDAEPARAAVNAWTAEQTRGRIPQVAPPGSITARTRLVLVDTLYLKAPWQTPFGRSATRTEAFTLADGTSVRVPTMHGSVWAATARGDGWRSVRLSYAGGGVAMTLVLPEPGRLAEVEAGLADGGSLAALLPTAGRGEVVLALPRWTFRSTLGLAGPLASLGMSSAFGPDADFSAMTTDERLRIDAVLQEVYVAVDEAGTEAAAATAVMVGTTAMPVQRESLVFDRPFLFVIHDVAHGTPLFLGRVGDPRG